MLLCFSEWELVWRRLMAKRITRDKGLQPQVISGPPIIRYNGQGYYWPHYHSATAMGDYLHGVAAVIEARACWNYYTSQVLIKC